MEIIINIKDKIKAEAFLNFIKSLDFVTVKENQLENDSIVMSDHEVIERVQVTNKQIQRGDTKTHDEVVKEFKSW